MFLKKINLNEISSCVSLDFVVFICVAGVVNVSAEINK